MFTGKIDETIGSALGQMASTVVDDSDDFTETIRVDPLLAVMPGRRDTSDKYTAPGTSIAHLVWQALHKCGYRSLNREVCSPYVKQSMVAFYAPLDGSTWSDWRAGFGANRKAGRSASKLNLPPTFSQRTTAGDGGIALTEGYAYYDKSTPESIPNEFTTFCWVGSQHAGTATLKQGLDGVSIMETSINGASKTVTLTVNGRAQSSVKYPGEGIIRVHIDTYSSRYEIAHLVLQGGKMSTGQVLSSGEMTVVDGNVKAWRLSSLEITATTRSQISHVLVDKYGGTEIRDRGAVVNLPTQSNRATYTPSVRDNQAATVIGEVSEALCCPAWFDADGIFHLEYGKYLKAAPREGTISASKMSSIPFKVETLMMASTVRVSAKEGSQTRSKAGMASVTAWQGSGQTVGVNESIEEFVGPEAGEDWIEPDTTFTGNRIWTGTQDKAQLKVVNDQSGSVYLTEMSGGAPGDWFFTCTEVTPWRWKLAYSSEASQFALKIPEGNGYGLDYVVRGDPTPIFRAGAVVKAEPQAVAEASTDAPFAPELEHDADIWGQGDTAETLAKDIAAAAGQFAGTYFASIETWWDPAVDIGKVYTLDLREPYGVTAQVMVLSVSQDHTEDRTTVTFRIISITGGISGAVRDYAEVRSKFKTYTPVREVGKYSDLLKG